MRAVLWSLLLVGLLASVVLAQECQQSDYEGQYTQCRVSNTHDYVYYLKRNVTCTGGAPPPHPVFDLPCNITCDDGEYLPPGSINCAPCEPGSYTRGGGESVTEWNTWPTNLGVFSTYCINNQVAHPTPINCSGWVLNGANVRSGLITDAQSSILVLQTQLIIAGVVRFSYRADAEPFWDGLIFYVDGNITLPKKSVTTGYTEFSVHISTGYHTLSWEYYKDRDMKRGEDAAYIRSIEIVGLTYAESSCTPCEVGTYTDKSSTIQCSPCPLNTYADVEGSTVCTECPAGQFSYMGSSTCQAKVPCTAADYQYLYGDCTSGNTRTATAVWLNPHICDDSSFSLPAPVTNSCVPCAPGTTQDGSFQCVPCESGTYSQGAGAPCVPCGTGHAATKVLSLTSFDEWPAGATTTCIGYCGTNGWRLRSGFIDSGAGHGETVDSSFTLPVVLEQPGFVTFTFMLSCIRFCSFYYLDFPYDASIQWNTSSVKNFTLVTYTTPIALEVGPHNLTWTFESESFDPRPLNYVDSARIYSIVINGTTVGGASKCTPCALGSVAGERSSFCTNCTAGYSNSPAFDQCQACTGNSFSPFTGGSCYNCGPTTVVNSNHTDCTDTCSFVINGDTYDLTPIASGPFGPIRQPFGNPWENLEYHYYINLCGRGGFVKDCHDIDDNPLSTHVCQVLPYGYALDVGWSSGYHPVPLAVAEKGFTARYDLGVLGCGPKNNGVAYHRSTNLTFICDPTAGIGTLQADRGVENSPCVYSFIWRSLYACPICSKDDYTFYYTLCDASSKRTKVYYWKDPVLCHSGEKLPAAEVVSCSDSNVQCGIGQQLSADGQSCIPCPADQYSVGGGVLIRYWPTNPAEDLPYGYTSSCTTSCTPWSSNDGLSIHSGDGDSSLYGSHTFRVAGSISFKYKVYAPEDGGLVFYVDGLPKKVVQKVSMYQWANFSYDVAAGSHIFQWRFTSGMRYSVPLLNYQSASITDILVQGLDLHADSCLPCPEGTTAPTDPTVIGCVPCPANTYNTMQTSHCTPCPDHQFSLPGSTFCQNKTACTPASYLPQYTACVNGTRDVSYTPALPEVCSGGTAPPLPRYGIPCAACPPYTVAHESECVSCASGEYFNSDLKQCVTNVPGYIVQYAKHYFHDDTTTGWPAGFFTGCSGVCGTNGWRLAGASIDSGFHSSNVVDSYVGISANFVYNGQVTFTYIADIEDALDISEEINGLQFLIDGRVISIPVPHNSSHPVKVVVEVPNGLHELVWNYHQETFSGVISVSNIIIQGVQEGEGVDHIPCDPGTFSSDINAVNCSVCPAGYYSPVAGSNACAPCLKGTYNPNTGADVCRQCDFGSSTNQTGSTQCSTECIFTIGSNIYDLTELRGPVTAYDSARQQYLINVCNNVGSPCNNSHACIVLPGNSVVETGNSFKFIPDPSNSTAVPFSIAFEHGDACPGANVERSTLIEFECAAENPSNIPEFERQDENCVSIFTWRTAYACRKCTDSDYTTISGGCSGGRRQVSKTRIASCNGPSSIIIKNEKCSGQEFPLAAIIVIVLVFVAVVAVAAFIFFRNRRLAAQYASLIEETRTSNISM